MRTSNNNSHAWPAFLGCLMVAFIAVLVPSLRAQTFYGSIVGIVTDSSGSVLTAAAVTVTNTGTAEHRSVQTDSNGSYQFVNLVPGNYRIEIESTGFKRFRRDSILVEVQSTVRVDVTMQVGEVNQEVVVTAETTLLETDTSALGQVIESRAVQELPLNGRNVMNLIALVPGVVPQGQTQGNPATNNVNGWGNYQIGGSIANQSAEYIDGAPLNVNYAHLPALIPAQDAVQEFRVQTNSLGPEFGDSSGGVVSLTTKSGSNAFHGTLYEFLRNKVLNGNGFFSNEYAQARPAFTQNQYGASLGGPVIKNKTFFFFNWENFALRQGNSYVSVVPTPAERVGDFSGAGVPIYDALTTCGAQGTPDCAAGQPTRQAFPGNIIPASRLNPTAMALLQTLWPLPNAPGQQNNFATTYSAATNSSQYNARVDENVSDKQRIFARYSFWNSTTPPVDPFDENNGLGSGFQTNQAVLGDTYSFTPTTIGDLRVAFLRFTFNFTPQSAGVDQTKFGLPASYDSQELFRNNPIPCVAGFSDFCNQNMGNVVIDTNNSYSIMPSLTKIAGHHTLKLGAELRRMEFNFAQTTTASGFFEFDNLMTSSNPFSPGNTGFGLASFLLGYGSSGSISEPALTAATQYYEGFYAGDTFQIHSKWTLNYGVRWELPGPWTERRDLQAVFLPNEQSPLAQATNLPLNGNVALVNSQEYPSRYSQEFHMRLFAPRVGLAYRFTNKTVIRAGYGIFFVPNDVSFLAAPWVSPVNQASTPWVTSLNGGATPYATLSNPFPSGILDPLGRSPALQSTLYGTGITLPVPNEPYGYTQQWNFSIERELGAGAMMEVAYAGSKGTHLPGSPQNIDQLPDQYLSLGQQLVQPVANPFSTVVPSGTILSQPTVIRGQLMLPYPQFTGVYSAEPYNRDSSYQSLQVKFEKRFHNAGTLLAAYSFSKLIADTDTLTGWLEDGGCGCAAQVQDNNNLRLERSLSQTDIPHRLVVSYVLDLPVGKGKRLLHDVGGVTDKLISGWGINGISTFQSGLPLSFSTASNPLSQFGVGSLRPNVNGPNESVSGSAQSRINEWFNVADFSQPSTFSLGNEARLDPVLRSAGINNWDFAVFKTIPITERIRLQFRTEFFNIFNRVQFGAPNTACCTDNNSQFGVVTAQANNPRLVQFALRLMF
jgi:hypothetical protein